SGTHPGAIRIQASAYEATDVNYEHDPIASAVGIPVTIATGPPSFGTISMSYVDLLTPGGGIYQIPMSVSVWDLHSNPVADSTTVWLSLYEFAAPWGEIGSDGEIDMIDSLVYKCTYPATELIIEPDTFLVCGEPPTTEAGLSPEWTQNIHPGYIEGEAKTGEMNMNGDAYKGIAWASSYYTSLNVFKDIIIKAHTYDGEGEYLLIDSRDSNDGAPFDQPILPGAVTIGSSVVFWDFSTFPNVNNPADITGAGCFTDVIQVSANLTDYYMEAISDGRLQLNVVGGVLLDPNPPIDPAWDGNQVQITDPNGQARWYIRYNINLCPVTDPQTCNEPNDCDACEYDDFTSAIWVNLLDPQQMTSNQVEIQLIRSGGECDNCP
ncbi:MAG: hypothetical protein ACE5D7_01220, partial [Fidelibacterota bacterium]